MEKILKSLYYTLLVFKLLGDRSNILECIDKHEEYDDCYIGYIDNMKERYILERLILI